MMLMICFWIALGLWITAIALAARELAAQDDLTGAASSGRTLTSLRARQAGAR